MPIVNQYFQPEHGLQIEETHEAGDQNGVHHLFRYWYAWAYIRTLQHPGSHVEDWGCGCGFGARILAEQNPGYRVSGLDNDPAALVCAKTEYRDLPNISFYPLDFDTNWTTPAGIFGHHPVVIVCFDLVGFLTNRELFFQRLAKACRDDNSHVLFSSSHCSEGWVDLNPEGRDKKIEYSQGLTELLLRPYFKSVKSMQDEDFPLANYVKQISDYAGYAVGEDIIVCKDVRK